MRKLYVQGEVGPRCATAASERGRKRYQKPRIIARESLRAFAALCSPGKGPGQPDDCQNIVAS